MIATVGDLVRVPTGQTVTYNLLSNAPIECVGIDGRLTFRTSREAPASGALAPGSSPRTATKATTSGGSGWWIGDYKTRNATIRHADVQGLSNGIDASRATEGSLGWTLEPGNSHPQTPDRLFLYDFDGVAGRNYQVFYTEQGSQDIAGGRATCTCTSTRPEK